MSYPGILAGKATQLRLQAADNIFNRNDGELDVNDDYLPAHVGAQLHDRVAYWLDIGIPPMQLGALLENLAATCQ
jgi:hypothetical protein